MTLMTILLSLLSLISTAALPDGKESAVSRKDAVHIIREHYPASTVLKSILHTESGERYWSIVLKLHGSIKEVRVDAETGELIDDAPDQPAADSSGGKTTGPEATALKKIPGEIVGRKVTIAHGKTIIDFDIKTRKGMIVRVDVDSVSNSIIDIESELQENGSNHR